MRIQEHISLKKLTTLKIGGTARYFCSVERAEELTEALTFARERNIRYAILGGGSNILVANGGIEVLVIKIDIKGIGWQKNKESVLVIAGAGESWDGLVAKAVGRGLWGIENLSGIPGTVGAAPIQNIGAYGTEIQETVEWVEVFDTETREMKQLTNEECQFSYRDSIFKHPEGKALIVTRVALRLKKSGVPDLDYKDLKNYFSTGLPSLVEEGRGGGCVSLQRIRRAVLEIRSKKFPDLREFGTAGSFFKNPVISKERFNKLKTKFPNLPGFELGMKDEELRIKIPLAWILDNVCNLRGMTHGNVGLFKNQPIVLVNLGGATAKEVRALAKQVIDCVKEETGITIEWEVQSIC